MLRDRIARLIRWGVGLLSASLVLILSSSMPAIHRSFMSFFAAGTLMASLVRLRREPPPAVSVSAYAEPAIATASCEKAAPSTRATSSRYRPRFHAWGSQERATAIALGVLLIILLVVWLKR